MKNNNEEVEELPDEYFKTVISEVVKKEKIKDFTTIVTSASGKGENFLGLLYRVKVTGVKENGQKAKLSLILKVVPKSEIFRDKFPVEMLYIKEVYVYNVLLPELCALQDKYNVPDAERFHNVRCYSADSEKFKEFLVLEDMCSKGFRVANRRESLGRKHLELVLKSMARFHALSFVLKKLDAERFHELAKNTSTGKEYESFSEFFKLARDRALAVVDDPVVRERADAFTADVMDKLDCYINPDFVKPYSVMCHGDFWNNNILFRFEEEEPVDIIPVDWQVAHDGSPITDIAYFIFTSTDYEIRKEHLQDLLDYYFECLTKSLANMECDVEDHFPRAVFDEHLKKMLPFGLFMSFVLLPAVLGEAEDVPDMDALLSKEKVELDDVKFVNKDSSNRFKTRIVGVIRTFIEMNLI